MFSGLKTSHRIVILAALTSLAAVVYHGLAPDEAYLAYRIAGNMATGEGFRLTADAPLFIAGANPIYALVLSVGAMTLGEGALPLFGYIVSALAILAIGVSFLLLDEDGDAGFITGLVAVTLPPLWLMAGLDLPFWLALLLGGLAALNHEKRIPSAVLFSLAALIRPLTGLLLIVLMTFEKPSEDGNWRDQLVIPIALALIHGLLIFGARGLVDYTIPPDVAAFAALGESLTVAPPSFWWAGLFSLPLVFTGLFVMKRLPRTDLLCLWGMLGQVPAVFMEPENLIGHLALFILAWAALTGAGAAALLSRMKENRLLSALVLILTLAGNLIFGAVLYLDQGILSGWEELLPERESESAWLAGEWLVANTLPGERAATAYAGVMAAAPATEFVDPAGRLDPEIARAAARGDVTWWLFEEMPEWLVIEDSDTLSFSPASPFMDIVYARVGLISADAPDEPILAIYRRQLDPGPVSETLINFVTFDPPIILNRIAADFLLADFNGSPSSYLRLEWLLEAGEAEAEDAVVGVRLVDTEGGVLAYNERELTFSRWPEDAFITSYHPVALPPSLAPGAYWIEVGVGATSDDLTWEQVAPIKNPFPTDPYMGAITGLNADFGAIHAAGYRFSRDDAGLHIMLQWETVRTPGEDYLFNFEIIDGSGNLITGRSFAPHDGRYPTTVWSPGEIVMDEFDITIDGLPAGTYRLLLSLIRPDGEILPLEDGTTNVVVGEFTVN